MKVLYKKISLGQYKIPSFLSESAKDLIKNILCVDLTKRFNLSQIKQHSWFKNVNQPLDEGIFIGMNEIKIERSIVDKSFLILTNVSKDEIENSVKNNNHNDITTT